nr:MAG TPA: hypothetical protein [Caudoviricetes sp.]
MLAITLDIKCCGSGASRLLVGKSSRQSQNKWSVSLPCRVRIAALPQRKEHWNLGWVLPHVFRLRTKADITQCSYLLCAHY